MTKYIGSTVNPAMSYLPFHHKYRPQTFADLVGQEAITVTLTNALRLGKVAPAYLFTGPRGTGKTSSARIFAKSLNCTASPAPTAQPCGECGVCKSITNGSALDVIEIDAASNTGVDNIRELIDRAQYAPVQCRYKVYTIDECHMLSTAAFNSLLKTLEEPPPRVVFILATTDPQRVLPTIISRCQKFDYRRIPLEAMVGHLGHIANLEKMQIDPAALRLVAQISQGGLRDAESLLDQLSLSSTKVTIEQVWDLVGAVPEGDLLGICTALYQGDLVGLLDRGRQLLERGKEPLTILQNLAGFYRDLAIAKSAPQRPDLTTLTAETWEQAVTLAGQLELSTILFGQQRLKESEAQLKGSTQPHLWLEIALLALLPAATVPVVATPIVMSKAIASISSPVAAVVAPVNPVAEVAPEPLPSEPVPVAIAETPVPPVATPVVLVPEVVAAIPAPEPEIFPEPEPVVPALDLPVIWQKVLQQLLPSGKGLFTPHGNLLSIEGNVAIIGMKSSTLSKLGEGQKPHLEKALTNALGMPMTVVIQLMGKSKAAPATATPKAAPAVPPSARVEIPQPQSTRVVADLPGEEVLDEVEEDQESAADWEPPVMLPPENPVNPITVVKQIVAETPQPFAVPVVIAPHMPDVFEDSPEIPDSFTVQDLDAAAANLADRFHGEIVEEYVTIWDL
jgi:DNA polymerase III subunit gamma/tau